MKKTVLLLIFVILAGLLWGCGTTEEQVDIAATTLPVYEFTARLCEGTGITVGRVVTENVSCLHNYSLQISQMRMLEGAELIVISGAGLEDFLELDPVQTVCDASVGIELLCPEDEHHHDHHEHGHNHGNDPHIWLCPSNAKHMCTNICENLRKLYPEHSQIFQDNLSLLSAQLDQLQAYGENSLCKLNCREIITFHDGFSYFADAFGLTVLEAVEEESGSEASAAELIDLIGLVSEHNIDAIFIERNGSVSAADIIAAETGASVYTLDMAMSGESYFTAMYHNIDTIKEALG